MTDNRDLVLIDARGTGKSGALRCKALKEGWSSVPELTAEVAACGRQLGSASDRYGSGSIARNVDAVRKALGYQRNNYVSASYATVHGQAYAALFPEHLRSIVADAGRLFARLAHRVAHKPATGTGYDAFGNPHPVVVDEAQLAAIADNNPLNPGEIAAAAVALREGDPAPLLRLGAETPLWPGHHGNPRVFSMGANAATYCNDQDTVWQRDWSLARRAETYEDALEHMRANAFAPFTVEGWAEYFWPDFCIGWPAPDRFTPAVPAQATFPETPVLVLSGDLDTIVPTEVTRQLTDAFSERDPG